LPANADRRQITSEEVADDLRGGKSVHFFAGVRGQIAVFLVLRFANSYCGIPISGKAGIFIEITDKSNRLLSAILGGMFGLRGDLRSVFLAYRSFNDF
jgi:hypothetical protein